MNPNYTRLRFGLGLALLSLLVIAVYALSRNLDSPVLLLSVLGMGITGVTAIAVGQPLQRMRGVHIAMAWAPFVVVAVDERPGLWLLAIATGEGLLLQRALMCTLGLKSSRPIGYDIAAALAPLGAMLIKASHGARTRAMDPNSQMRWGWGGPPGGMLDEVDWVSLACHAGFLVLVLAALAGKYRAVLGRYALLLWSVSHALWWLNGMPGAINGRAVVAYGAGLVWMITALTLGEGRPAALRAVARGTSLLGIVRRVAWVGMLGPALLGYTLLSRNLRSSAGQELMVLGLMLALPLAATLMVRRPGSWIASTSVAVGTLAAVVVGWLGAELLGWALLLRLLAEPWVLHRAALVRDPRYRTPAADAAIGGVLICALVVQMRFMLESRALSDALLLYGDVVFGVGLLLSALGAAAGALQALDENEQHRRVLARIAWWSTIAGLFVGIGSLVQAMYGQLWRYDPGDLTLACYPAIVALLLIGLLLRVERFSEDAA